MVSSIINDAARDGLVVLSAISTLVIYSISNSFYIYIYVYIYI